ncbi:MAG: RIO1 family regulatory kinase/ATPase [Anaerolineae bacterium]
MRNYAHLIDNYDDDDTWSRRKPKPKAKRPRAEIMAEMVEEEHAVDGGFKPTFSASKHERAWIITYLGPFYEEHIISDVLRQVKGGKEATVYCCAAHPSMGVDLIAAKVYRPREFRQLRNDAQYRQGRRVLDDQGKLVKDDRMLHAVAKGSTFGKQLAHTSWLAHEYRTLQTLHAAGADVPRPWAIGENAILMEYLGEEGIPAPTLHETRLDRDEARDLFERLLHNIDLMLQHGLVHGDLSAFNVLYWEGDVKIIDFPQAVEIATNHDAFTLFQRDVQRLCQYFDRYGVAPHPRRLATRLWRRYVAEDDFEALNMLASQTEDDA